MNRKKPPIERFIAHAGGEVYKITYTNSLEALNKSYDKGFKLIELDFHWTKDGFPVCIHDWGPTAMKLFMSPPRRYTLKEFLSSPTLNNLTLLDLPRLYQWMKNHPDVYIIADIKEDPLKLLTFIKEKYPPITGNIIPQVFSLNDYRPIRSLSYRYIILALYKLKITNDDLLSFVQEHSVFAISLPLTKGFSSLPRQLNNQNIPTYAHTINCPLLFHVLRLNKVTGIFTDFLSPKG